MTGPRAAPAAASCLGKEKIDSMDLARQVATRVSRAHDRNMKAYKCPHCGYYHVGQNVGQNVGKGKPDGRPRIEEARAGKKARRP